MPILNRSESDVSTESKTSLDPEDWNAFREQAHRMLNHILDHQQSIAQKSVWQEMGPDIREGFRESLPQGPRSLQEIHRRFQDEILPYTLHNTHPRFFGWVQG